jgi:transcription elongation factor
VEDGKRACGHVQKLIQYWKSNVIIETKGRKSNFETNDNEKSIYATRMDDRMCSTQQKIG